MVRGCLVIAVVVALNIVGGCTRNPAVPRDRWLSGPQHSPHIFSTWVGDLSHRVVYDRDGHRHFVVVLENVDGPALLPSTQQAATSRLDAEPPKAVDRAVYLSNADKRLLPVGELPIRGRVKVDGFSRGRESGKVQNPKAGFGQPARRHPPGPEQPYGELSMFPMIKVRTIEWVDPERRPRVIWRTMIPFRGL